MDNAVRRRLDSQFAAARSLNPEKVVPVNERYKYTIEDVGLGDFIRLNSKTYVVKEIGVYKETGEDFKKKTGDLWTELKLFCIEDGESIHIEWEKDDEVEAFVTEKTLDFTQIKDDRGDDLDEDDLDDLAEEEDTIFYGKTPFEYDDDYAALYEREGKSPEKVYFYDFVSRDKKMITIEEWGSGGGREEYQLFLSREINPDSIELVAKS
ncbi:protein of unknown function [Desulfatibacillum alkenivorans DSM 16219]|jgi:hypothetical protein|uniref:DUF4178 domain-containing protein n=1 Tax=Desulfatibacillum alkenivorans DSM 16219 TaxID=1121393 RepID=A0A1M6SQL1_9BACT|nr:DUF4178 domain-containing protein [Desulfatibacillum alkenivorans]SHK46927.1 protein of unknown function [Desulfatibacillum alkenivorans DSM 16219]